MKFGSKEFFDYYEAAHQNANNRYLHHLSHGIASAAIIGFLFAPLACLVFLACAFGLSWTGHYFFEKNTPAFFETDDLEDLSSAVSHHVKIAVGGILWSFACFCCLFGLGPLAKPRQ